MWILVLLVCWFYLHYSAIVVVLCFCYFEMVIHSHTHTNNNSSALYMKQHAHIQHTYILMNMFTNIYSFLHEIPHVIRVSMHDDVVSFFLLCLRYLFISVCLSAVAISTKTTTNRSMSELYLGCLPLLAHECRFVCVSVCTCIAVRAETFNAFVCRLHWGKCFKFIRNINVTIEQLDV